jgi:hypothetical protein
MAYPVTGSNSDGFCFLCGHMKEQVDTVPPRTIEDLVATPQAAVTTASAHMLKRVRGNVFRRTAVVLEMDRGLFERLL